MLVYFHCSVQANGRLKLGKSKSIDPNSHPRATVTPFGNIVPVGGHTPTLLPLKTPSTAIPARHSIRSIDSGLGEDPNHSDRETASEVRGCECTCASTYVHV